MIMQFLSALRLKLRQRQGYNLLDVLIGMVVLSIALGSAFSLTATTSHLVQNNQHVAAASSLAEFKIEEFRNAAFDTVVDGADAGTINAQGQPGGIYSRAWTVASDSPAAGLKTVVVAITWEQWGQTRSYSLTGVIAP